MVKIVYNSCFGGFGLSDAALALYREYSGNNDPDLYEGDLDRADPHLVRVVEELGEGASGDYSRLRIEDVPAGARYRIDEYDGSERVMTVDDYDWKVA